MEARPPALLTQGLEKDYGGRPVIRSLDLRVEWGEVLLLVGPNGSGKTTLVKLLATLARPTAGRFWVAGLDPQRDGPRLRQQIGVVTHQTYLYRELTGRENLAFYGRMHGLGYLDQAVRRVASLLGLEPYLDQRVHTLSHGMQKRLSLARALLHDPPVLLLDEPETGLDQEALAVFHQLVREHRARGGAVLLTTHNLERGLELGDRVALLVDGRIAFQGERPTLDLPSLMDTYARLTGAARQTPCEEGV